MIVLAVTPAEAAVIGAGAAAIVNLIGIAALGVRGDRRRRREFYANALEATLAYREFAYAVPRRNRKDRAAERVRLSEAMRHVQRDLSRAEALLRIERATDVYVAYVQLVRKTRQVAGGYIRESWKQPPIRRDQEVNVDRPLDFSAIDPYQEAFLRAVDKDLSWYRWYRFRRRPPDGV
jgi:hypothetical protein